MESNVMPAMNFSQRMGIMELRIPVQVNSLDKDLRAGLWNALYSHFLGKLSTSNRTTKKARQLVVTIWTDFFRDTLDTLPSQTWGYGGFLQRHAKEYIFEEAYNRVFDFIEYIIPLIEQAEPDELDGFIADCNKALEKEGSVYRIINRIVVRTIRAIGYNGNEQTGEPETEERSGNLYFANALELMADRKDPNFNQAIGEAIKAVEWTLEKYPALTTPDNALSPLAVYHQNLLSLKQVLTEPGTAATVEETKYWLIICAAIINYLKGAGS